MKGPGRDVLFLLRRVWWSDVFSLLSSLRPWGGCVAGLGDQTQSRAVRLSHNRLPGNLRTQPIISDRLVSEQRLVDTEDTQPVPPSDQVHQTPRSFFFSFSG